MLDLMPNYRRTFVPGGSWFFTVNLLDRNQTLLVDQIETLRGAVAATRQSRAFNIDAFVVLPDHLHAVWSLPPGDSDFSTRWRLIKNRFARALPKQEPLSAVRVARNERGIWQRRFWEHLIRDEADLCAPRRILLYQSAQARSGNTRAGLAVLLVSSRRAHWNISA